MYCESQYRFYKQFSENDVIGNMPALGAGYVGSNPAFLINKHQ